MKTVVPTQFFTQMHQKAQQFPINDIYEEFINYINKNRTAFIHAPTATGKTTLIPIMLLLQEHYEDWKRGTIDLNELELNSHIICAVPTQAAAISAATYVAALLNVNVGDLVGFSLGPQKKFSSKTRILFATTGVVWLKELFQSIPAGNTYLILDECQAYTALLEASLAWGKYMLDINPELKLILMSATDTRSAQFIGAKIFCVESKMFPIEVRYNKKNIADTIVDLVEEGRNVLCFVPGKSDISFISRNIQNKLKELGNPRNTQVIPLHANLPLEEQSKAYISSSKVVVATNVAQTSITIPDIDAVVDTGLERRVVKIEEQFVFDVGEISYSDHLQRKGRAGRTRPGIYVWANATPIEELQKYPVPEIYVNGLETILLQIIASGIPINRVEFFHKPTNESYQSVMKLLQMLNAVDENGEITSIGKQMTHIPLSIRCSRMVVEAIKRGVVRDIATIASTVEIGGLKNPKVTYSDLGIKPKSDPINDMELFYMLYNGQKLPDTIPADIVHSIQVSYRKAYDLRDMIFDALDRMGVDINSTGNNEDILKSYAIGLIDRLFIRTGYGNWYSNGNPNMTRRKLSLTSSTLATKLVMGFPYSLTYKEEDGYQVLLHLIIGAISVDINFLKEIAPNLFSVNEKVYLLPKGNKYKVVLEKCFNGVVISLEDSERAPTIEEKRIAFKSYVIKQIKLGHIAKSFRGVDEISLEKHVVNVIDANFKKLPDSRRTDWYSKFNG